MFIYRLWKKWKAKREAEELAYLRALYLSGYKF